MGGEHRSRILHTPSGEEVTRPMTGRVKESIFNILRGWFEDAVVLTSLRALAPWVLRR